MDSSSLFARCSATETGPSFFKSLELGQLCSLEPSSTSLLRRRFSSDHAAHEAPLIVEAEGTQFLQLPPRVDPLLQSSPDLLRKHRIFSCHKTPHLVILFCCHLELLHKLPFSAMDSASSGRYGSALQPAYHSLFLLFWWVERFWRATPSIQIFCKALAITSSLAAQMSRARVFRVRAMRSDVPSAAAAATAAASLSPT